MYGAILGDMIGAPYEFDRGDKRKDFPLFGKGSMFTDDSVMTIAVAEALMDFRKRVDEKVENLKLKVESLIPKIENFDESNIFKLTTHAIIEVLREDIKACRAIRFDGNGYSDEWRNEAARRGLDTEGSVPIVIDRYLDDASVEMFRKTNVFTRAELQARNEIKWETYTKKVQIEARVFGDLCLNHIIPVATRYQSQLIDNVHKTADIFPADTAQQLSANNIVLIKQIAQHTAFITENVERLVEARRVANRIDSVRQRAIAYHDTVAPLLEDIRYHVDKLELVVDDELWPLPKYRELLFIR